MYFHPVWTTSVLEIRIKRQRMRFFHGSGRIIFPCDIHVVILRNTHFLWIHKNRNLALRVWIPRWRNSAFIATIHRSTQFLLPSHDVKCCLGMPCAIDRNKWLLEGIMSGEYGGLRRTGTPTCGKSTCYMLLPYGCNPYLSINLHPRVSSALSFTLASSSSFLNFL